MSKDYLEALEKIKQEFNCDPEYYGLGVDFEILESALHRLESIDNANPSEALGLVKRTCELYVDSLKLRDLIGYDIIEKQINEALDIIKQALLKAQEPKHYLKWEDLKFTDERQTIKVLLNGKKYFVKYKKEYLFGYYEKVEITNGTFILCTLGNGMKQFFNDLHLERAEE